MTSESRPTEFARLFTFFERLASYKSHSRTDDDDCAIDGIDSMSLPPDLVPIVANLINLVNSRVCSVDARQKKKLTGRKRSHTIATTSCAPRDIDSDNSDEESITKFPLGKRYTFTFKLMLHRLYQMDDWKQKVKDVLERSQNEYKPLSETTVAADAKKRVEREEEKKNIQDGCVHFKAGTGTPGGSRKPGARPRANSTLALETIKERKSSGLHLKSPRLSTMIMKTTPPAEECARALKKRCVGRRKSLSGPLSTEGGRIGSTWIYNTEVSAGEVAKWREIPDYQEIGFGGTAHQLSNTALGENAVEKRRVSLEIPGANAEKTDSRAAKRRRNTTIVHLLRKRPLEL